MSERRLEFDACLYSVPEAVDRFVPSLVWNEVRLVNKHRLLIGGTGSGKTMLMKRLSWTAMLKKPDFIEDGTFAAFYFDIRELEDLNCLFSEKLFPRAQGDIRRSFAIASCLATLHLLHVISDTVFQAGYGSLYNKELTQSAVAVTSRVLGNAFSMLKCETLENVMDIVMDLKFRIASAIADSTQLDQRINFAESIAPPEIVLRIFAADLNRRCSLRIGLLVDQYEMLPRELNPIFNGLLKRENLSRFFATIASRPFAFDSFLDGGDSVQRGEDFDVVLGEYLPEERREYATLLGDILAHFRNGGPRIEEQLEQGIEFFAALSSRSIRLFLLLCHEIGLPASRLPISLAEQESAGRRVSVVFRDQLKTTAGIPQGQIWRLISEFTRPADELASPSVVKLSYEVKGPDQLSRPAAMLLRKTFEEGAIQFTSRPDCSALSLPDSFSVSRIVYPALRRDPSMGLTSLFAVDKIEQMAREMAWAPSPVAPGPKAVSKVFLSLSFEETPEATTVRDLVVQTFEGKGVQTLLGHVTGRGMIAQVAQKIRDSDLTVVVLNEIRPNILLEMAVALGLGKHVFLITDSRLKRLDLSGYHFLLEMGTIGYDLTPRRMSAVISEILDRYKTPPSDVQLLRKSIDGTSNLMIKQQSKTLAIYYPSTYRSLWQSLDIKVLELCRKVSWSYLPIQGKPHRDRDKLTLLDHLVWATRKAEHVIVDTTGEGGPDPYGAFALGFATALTSSKSKKAIWRIEQSGQQTQAGLSMWPGEKYRAWSNRDDLLRFVEEMISRPERS